MNITRMTCRLSEMQSGQEGKFDISKINLAELERRTARPGPSNVA